MPITVNGSLVIAPLLDGISGCLAVACMAALLVLDRAIGRAIRFHIQYFEPTENQRHGIAQSAAFLSRIVLASAYFILVTYYPRWVSAFLLKAVKIDIQCFAHSITTTLLAADSPEQERYGANQAHPGEPRQESLVETLARYAHLSFMRLRQIEIHKFK